MSINSYSVAERKVARKIWNIKSEIKKIQKIYHKHIEDRNFGLADNYFEKYLFLDMKLNLLEKARLRTWH